MKLLAHASGRLLVALLFLNFALAPFLTSPSTSIEMLIVIFAALAFALFQGAVIVWISAKRFQSTSAGWLVMALCAGLISTGGWLIQGPNRLLGSMTILLAIIGFACISFWRVVKDNSGR